MPLWIGAHVGCALPCVPLRIYLGDNVHPRDALNNNLYFDLRLSEKTR